MEWSVHEIKLKSLTPQKQKKVLSDDHARPVLDLHETQSLYDIRLNPAEDLTAARGIMGSKSASLPNFAMKKDSSDPHLNTFTQNALLLATQRRCESMDPPLNLTLDRNDPHLNTFTQNALLLAPRRRCESMDPPLNFNLDDLTPVS